MVNQREKVPDKMVSLNFRLTPSLRAGDVEGGIQAVVDGLLGESGQKIEGEIEEIRKKIEGLREFMRVSEEDFKQVCSYFGEDFRVLKQKNGLRGEQYESSRNLFKRESFQGSRP